jgi:predicted phosphodiesterase
MATTTGLEFAVIADVHGNRWALEAVLQDMDQRHIRRFINLGDTVYGPLDPGGTADLLMSLRQRTVRGNEDRIITDDAVSDVHSPTLAFTRDQLNDRHRQWLAGLSLSATLEPDVFYFHGTPDRDDEYLLHEVTTKGLQKRSPEGVAALLDGIGYPLILCGHDHLPGALTLPDGRLVVNPGSVGLQAYTDDQPYGHAVSNHSPHARYAVVKRTESGWAATHVQVEYDWNAVAEIATDNGRRDWAHWLRTG